MHTIKEAFFAALVAMLGMALAWWCYDIFGANACGNLLQFSGPCLSLGAIAVRWLNTGFSSESELLKYDETTRELFSRSLLLMKKKMMPRMIIGFALGSVSTIAGILLSEAEKANDSFPLLVLVGGGTLAASVVLLGTQVWAASWIAEFLAKAKAKAEAEQRTREKIARYEGSYTEDRP